MSEPLNLQTVRDNARTYESTRWEYDQTMQLCDLIEVLQKQEVLLKERCELLMDANRRANAAIKDIADECTRMSKAWRKEREQLIQQLKELPDNVLKNLDATLATTPFFEAP